jgi:peroxiredoxin
MKENKSPIHRYKTKQSPYYPSNAHNVTNVELFKHIKIIMEAAPACFGLQRNHHQGTTASI